MGKTTSVLLAVMLAACLAPEKGRATSRFLVAPPSIRLESVPASIQTQTLSVINLDSFRVLHVQAYAADWSLNERGETVFLKAGSLPQSCAGWMEINPVDMQVPPLAEQNVRLTIAMPDSAAGSHWAVVFFESLPESVPLRGNVGINLKARVGSLIFADPAGTLWRHAEIAGIGYRRTGYKGHEAKVRLKNLGNTCLRPKGTVFLRTLEDKTVAQAALPEGALLPGSQRDYAAEIRAEVPPGEYRLEAEVDCGTAEIMQGEIRISIKE
jgi:hypothetical protein